MEQTNDDARLARPNMDTYYTARVCGIGIAELKSRHEAAHGDGR